MSPITRLWNRARCHVIGCHQLDWLYEHETGVRRCEYCLTLIPGLTVRHRDPLHPDVGD